MQELDQYLETGKGRQLPSVPPKNGNRPPDLANPSVSEITEENLRILVSLPGDSENMPLQAYGEYIARLLHSEAIYQPASTRESVADLRRAVAGCHLLIFGEPQQSVLRKFIFGPVGRRLAQKTPATILVVERPRWPIHKILLIVRLEALEAWALDWAGRFARASGAELTILPLIPAQPLMYGTSSGLQVGVDALLTPGTPSGKRLRALLDQLKHWQVSGTLRVRQGEPLQQIRWEIDEGEHDLVVIGAEPGGRLRSWLFGDLVGPLINMANRPLLVAMAVHPGKPGVAN